MYACMMAGRLTDLQSKLIRDAMVNLVTYGVCGHGELSVSMYTLCKNGDYYYTVLYYTV